MVSFGVVRGAVTLAGGDDMLERGKVAFGLAWIVGSGLFHIMVTSELLAKNHPFPNVFDKAKRCARQLIVYWSLKWSIERAPIFENCSNNPSSAFVAVIGWLLVMATEMTCKS
jgi:hypothetical protein